MYSMVLMVAMNTSADMPDFGRRGGGCCGCYGGGWGGCYGGGWGGGWGGCYGGGWGGGWGGCYGRGYGMGWGGCYGGGWGGCYGGGWGGGWGGGYGGGMGLGGFGYGGYVLSSPAITPAYSLTPAVSTAVVSTPAVRPANALQPGNATQSMYFNPGNASGERPAMVTVHVPKNAKLFIDDKPSQNTASTRRFQTPPLPAGRDFHYTLRAEMDRDGQPMTTSKTITVRAGKPTEVTLSFPRDDE